MAGGEGKRLGAITRKKPKPAVNINGRPFIYYKLDWLSNQGFKKFIFLISYKSDILYRLLEKYFLQKGLTFKVFHDKNRSGTFNAIFEIRHKLESTFFYTNADEISSFCVKDMYNSFLESKSKIMALVTKYHNPYLVLENHLIKERNYCESATHIELGCKFISKDVFSKVPNKYEKLEDYLYGELLKKTKVHYYEVSDVPKRIDTPADIKNYNDSFI